MAKKELEAKVRISGKVDPSLKNAMKVAGNAVKSIGSAAAGAAKIAGAVNSRACYRKAGCGSIRRL